MVKLHHFYDGVGFPGRWEELGSSLECIVRIQRSALFFCLIALISDILIECILQGFDLQSAFEEWAEKVDDRDAGIKRIAASMLATKYRKVLIEYNPGTTQTLSRFMQIKSKSRCLVSRQIAPY